MRLSLPSLVLLAASFGMPALAQLAPDPVADSIVHNLTRGLRIPGQSTEPPTTPGGVVQSTTTAPPEIPAVSLMIVFDSGSAALSRQAEAVVASLARALATPALAKSRFRIEGHTDAEGDAPMNQALSERRAEAVREVLVTRYGVAPMRLETVGFGETQLLVPTPDGQAEARNRRVQVINLGE